MAVFILSLIPVNWVKAATLINVRTGNNDQFTRVVFEFQDNVLSEKPEIKEAGIFSIVFRDSTTNLPPIKSFATNPVKLIRSIEFVQQESDLMASVQLSIPFSTLNCFSLADPDRVIIDAYQMPLLRQKVESPHTRKEDYLSPMIEEQKTSENADTLKVDNNLEVMAIQAPESTLIEKELEQTIPTAVKSSSNYEIFLNKFYLLAIFNVLVSLILLLMIFMLLKHQRPVQPSNILEVLGFIKRSNNRIRLIDDQLKRELKKFEEQ